ncbi:MAG: membrane protein insertase YidC [Candidatus Omnitrophica bacterium]|nr:membrane protein insertase YidC [Candidatus Omnitrophota bacterium]
MGRKALLAFFLSLLVITSYNYYLAQKYPPALPEETIPQTQLPAVPSDNLIQPIADNSPIQKAKLVPAPEVVVETDLVKLVLTTSGARIKSCLLKKHPEEQFVPESVQRRIAANKQSLIGANAQTKELLLRDNEKQQVLLEKIKRKPEQAELVSLAATVDSDFAPAIVFPADSALTQELNTARYQASQAALTLNQSQPEGTIEFVYKTPRGESVKKSFTFHNSNYGIELDINLSNWPKRIQSEKAPFLFYGPNLGLPQVQQGRRSYVYQGPVIYFLNAQQGWVQKEKYTREENDKFVQRPHHGTIGWAGLETKYFLAALIPAQPASTVLVEKNRFGEQKVGLQLPWPGSGQYNFRLYLGPKREDRLREIGTTLEKSKDYGFFGPIARLIYQILVFFSRWTHNFGWAIVLLCLVTKIVFYPLTHHSFEAMQKMQQQMKAFQPEMDALREKHRDNPQKLNKEIMELYRKKGINPLASCQSGCLPMLLQMPVFFALYSVLYNAIELRATPFIGWITDLSAKDPYYVLPILMGISMFVQQKLTGMGGAGGAQQDHAKMMAILMPIMLTWIFASLPSGVVLYWLTFNVLTAAQQLFIQKKQRAAQIATG